MRDKNNALSHLLTAAGAIMFYTLALPMLDSVSSWVQNCFSAKNIKLQHDTKQYQDDSKEGAKTNIIGFQVESEEEYDDE